MATNWIPETEAAKKVGREPRTLRRKVKTGAWDISFTCLDGRGFHYLESDLNKLLIRNAKLVRA